MMQKILPKIKNKKIILFGEIHGTKEIPEMLSKFFSELAKIEDFNICLEIPNEFQNQIDFYLSNGNESFLRNILFFSKKYCLDGRNSLEYFNLIKKIYSANILQNRKIKIFCVSPSFAKNQDEIEKGIAENILIIPDDKKIFAVLGNIHASKNKIQIYNQKIIPAGFWIYEKLKDNLFSVLLNAKSGEFFNNKLQKIESSDDNSFKGNFDFTIELKEVSPCSFL